MRMTTVKRTAMGLAVLAAMLLVASVALAQSGGDYDLSWSTVDGGGYTFSAGSNYELGGHRRTARCRLHERRRLRPLWRLLVRGSTGGRVRYLPAPGLEAVPPLSLIKGRGDICGGPALFPSL